MSVCIMSYTVCGKDSVWYHILCTRGFCHFLCRTKVFAREQILVFNAIFMTFTVPYSSVPVFYTSLCAWVILKQMGFKHWTLDWQNSILSVFQIWCATTRVGESVWLAVTWLSVGVTSMLIMFAALDIFCYLFLLHKLFIVVWVSFGVTKNSTVFDG